MVDTDFRRNLQGARDFAGLMTATPPDPAWYDETVAALLRLPAYVRRGLTGELVGRDGKPISTNADLAETIKLPLMVVTGERDALSDGNALAQAYRSRYPAARVQVYADSGHSPFAEEPRRFDADLAAFISAISDQPRDGD
jgi:pimeloyl-ACP methyl ester carboxylesterase